MNIRLKSLFNLLSYYGMFIVFAIIYVEFIRYFIYEPVNGPSVIGTMTVFSTIISSNVVNNWKQLIFGKENKGSIPKNKETDTVFEKLKEEPKVDHRNLKGNPLDD